MKRETTEQFQRETGQACQKHRQTRAPKRFQHGGVNCRLVAIMLIVAAFATPSIVDACTRPGCKELQAISLASYSRQGSAACKMIVLTPSLSSPAAGATPSTGFVDLQAERRDSCRRPGNVAADRDLLGCSRQRAGHQRISRANCCRPTSHRWPAGCCVRRGTPITLVRAACRVLPVAGVCTGAGLGSGCLLGVLPGLADHQLGSGDVKSCGPDSEVERTGQCGRLEQDVMRAL